MSLQAKNEDDGGVWIGVDFGTTHSSVAVWDSTRGSPKWMRLGKHGLASSAEKVGRLVPSKLLLRHVPENHTDETYNSSDDDVWQDVTNLVHAATTKARASDDSSSGQLQTAMGTAANQFVDQAWQTETTSSSTSNATTTLEYSAADVSQALVTSLKRQFAAATAHVDVSSSSPSQQPEEEETTTMNGICVTPLSSTVQQQQQQHSSEKTASAADGVSTSPAGTLLIPPTDLVAAFLRALREAADDYLHQRKTIRKHLQVPAAAAAANKLLKCTNVVVGVPAQYSHAQRQLLMQAARTAGFTGHVSTLTESTAAAMAYYGLFYGKEQQEQSSTSTTTSSNNNTILVFDMGGGTTDVTIAEFTADGQTTTTPLPTAAAASSDDDEDPSRRFRVVVTQGDGRLGGDDMDETLGAVVLQKAAAALNQESSNNDTTSNTAGSTTNTSTMTSLSEYQRRSLVLQCQRAKEELCTNENESGGGDDDSAGSSVFVTIQGQRIELTRNDLNSAIEPLLERARTLVETAMEQYYYHQHEPQQQQEHEHAEDDSNDGQQQQRERYPMSEIILIGGATRVPAVRRMLQKLFPAKELCVAVNAMSAVAQGAAIQAAILSKHVPLHELESALMIDSSPHAIGVLIKTPGEKKTTAVEHNDQKEDEERFVEILPKDSPLPAMGYATFQLADPCQPGVTVVAVEEIRTAESHFYAPLGEFTFLLHRLGETERSTLLRNGEARSVDIGMTLKEDGAFIVSIFDENDPEHIRKKQRYQRAKQKDEEGGASPRVSFKEQNGKASVVDEPMPLEQIMLLVGCVVLFGLYIVAKLVFQEELDDENGSIIG